MKKTKNFVLFVGWLFEGEGAKHQIWTWELDNLRDKFLEVENFHSLFVYCIYMPSLRPLA